MQAENALIRAQKSIVVGTFVIVRLKKLGASSVYIGFTRLNVEDILDTFHNNV